ncbi:MAG: hypothetical protein EBX37_08410 [Alphaproteobacteria bacterium]|nr:hypothetical protein [Alphaproteobacteria bacterium]
MFKFRLCLCADQYIRQVQLHRHFVNDIVLKLRIDMQSIQLCLKFAPEIHMFHTVETFLAIITRQYFCLILPFHQMMNAFTDRLIGWRFNRVDICFQLVTNFQPIEL